MNDTKLPDNWVGASLGDVAEIRAGQGFPKKYQGKSQGDIPFYKVKDISETVLNGLIYLDKANNYLNKIECNEINGKPFKKGTIVFAKIGEAIKLNRRAILSKDSLVDNNVMGLSPFMGVKELYLYYFLLTIKLGDLSRATTVPSVRKGDVENLEIPIPPLNEQKRIVTKIEELFTRLDGGVDDLERSKKQLKVYRQSLLKHAFEGKLTQEWRKTNKKYLEPASVLLERIRKERKKLLGKKYKELPTLSSNELNKLPKIPDTWLWEKAANIVNGVNNGSTPIADLLNTTESKIPFIKVYNLTFSGELNFNKDPTFIELETHKNQLSRSIVYPGDVLINIVGPPLGKVSLVTNIYPEWNINQAIVAFHSTIINSNYLLYAFQSKFIMNRLFRTGKATAGQTNLKLSTCRELPLPLIPLAEQNEIIKQLDTIIPSINKSNEIINYNLQKSKKLRQSILKKAFQGQLVSQDPKDEPASKLLERIKAERESQKPKRKSKSRRKRKSSQAVLV